MFLKKALLAAVGLFLACGMGALTAFAQEPQTQSQTAPSHEGMSDKERIERREQRRQRLMQRLERRDDRGLMREGYRDRLSELNLTDDQRKRREAIMERRLAGTKQQREELMRLRTHAGQLENMLNGTGEIGKRLDFLTQELNREANTITSKTNNMTVKENALAIKSEIEKIREQVQNVE